MNVNEDNLNPAIEHGMAGNPWKGLDSYQDGERLYGRDDEIEVLMSRIEYNVQTVVYGRSGIGKSSIINAGIFPRARRAGMMPLSVRLIHTTDLNHPSEPYIQQLRTAIENALARIGGTVEEVVKRREGHSESLWEYLHRFRFYCEEDGQKRQVIPMIVFDQFEEIFTLERDRARVSGFFSELADLLNGVMPDYLNDGGQAEGTAGGATAASSSNIFRNIRVKSMPAGPKYIEDNEFRMVITLREDYLSHLERSTTHIPSLKLNRYCLQPINEEQAATIIMQPCPGLVTPEVAHLIIEKVTGEKDFLLDGKPEISVDSAILSLYLSRLYGKMVTEGEQKITADLVSRFGDNIIGDFYQESVSSMRPEAVEWIEDNLLNNDGRRENVSVYNARHIGRLTDDELRYLCDERRLLRRFTYGGDQRIEYIHDILCPVIKERRDVRHLMKQQEEERRQLLEEEERKRRRLMAKNRRRLIAAVSVASVIVVGWLSWYLLTQAEYTERYAQFTTHNGWPIGVGEELSSKECRQMPLHYELSRKGWSSWKNPFTRVRVLNAKGKPTVNQLVSSPLVAIYEAGRADGKASQFAALQAQTARWEFLPDNDGVLTRQTAYGQDGRELYAIQYFRSDEQSGAAGQDGIDPGQGGPKATQLWANYIDRDGKSMRVRDNGADRMRISVENGYFTGYAFFSESGTPQSNGNGYFGYQYALDEKGRMTAQTPLDEFGDTLQGKTVTYTAFDEYGRWTEGSRGTARYTADQIIINRTGGSDTLRFDSQGMIAYKSYLPEGAGSRTTEEYAQGTMLNRKQYRQGRLCKMQLTRMDKQQRLAEVITYDADSAVPYRAQRYQYPDRQTTVVSYFGGTSQNAVNQPVTCPDHNGDYHRLVTVNDTARRTTVKTYYDVKGEPCYSRNYYRDESYFDPQGHLTKRLVYNREGICRSYLLEYDAQGHLTAQSVCGVDGKPIRCPQWDASRLCYYRMKFVRNFNGTYVAVKGINEFGEESLVTFDKYVYRMQVVPSVEMSEMQDDYRIIGTQFSKEYIAPVDGKSSVEYLHITDLKGSYYAAGVRDGDLLLGEQPGTVKVARPNPGKKRFDVMTFKVAGGAKGCEHYTIYYNKVEMDRYNQSIRSAQ